MAEEWGRGFGSDGRLTCSFLQRLDSRMRITCRCVMNTPVGLVSGCIETYDTHVAMKITQMFSIVFGLESSLDVAFTVLELLSW